MKTPLVVVGADENAAGGVVAGLLHHDIRLVLIRESKTGFHLRRIHMKLDRVRMKQERR